MTDPTVLPTGPHCTASRRYWLSVPVAAVCGSAPWFLPLTYALPVWLVAAVAGVVHVRAFLHIRKHA